MSAHDAVMLAVIVAALARLTYLLTRPRRDGGDR